MMNCCKPGPEETIEYLRKRERELLQHIKEVNATPRLGCATTRELLEELTARIEVDGKMDYRTVDAD